MASTQAYFNQNNFNAGQLSEKLHKRSDLTWYQNGVKESVNFLPQVHGPMYKRPGTRKVGTARSNTAVRLVPFVFSADTVYVLEFTPLKMRAYKDGALLGFTLTTTITSAMLDEMHFAQNGDTMYIVHEDLAPQQLTRFGDTTWTIHTMGFTPPATYEAGTSAATTMTLAAASGNNVLFTAGASFFLASDVNRFIVEKNGPGVAVILNLPDVDEANCNILTTFSDTSLASGEWLVLGSPSADIWINKTGLPGTIVTVDAYQDIDSVSSTELIEDGGFEDPFSSGFWTNRSSPLVIDAALNAGSADGIVIDTDANFITLGVQENYYIYNDTQGHRSYVARVRASNTIDSDNPDAAFADADEYRITQTGAAFIDIANGKCVINGERNGIGWIEQNATTTQFRVWCLKFRVEDSPVSMQIGGTSRSSEVYNEASFDIGEHEVYFWSDSAAMFVQFRNNQQTNAALTDVSLKEVSVAAFRSGDVGKYVRVLGGVIEITSVDASGKRCTGIIRSSLVGAEATEDIEVVAGLWSLESTSWSSTLGYPRVVALHDQRLYFGSTAEFPTTLWGSVIADFTNFNRGEANDDDAVTITPTATEINTFQWMTSEHNLAIGTGRNEFIVTSGFEGTITPTNRKVDTPSHWGSPNHRPLRVGDAIVFIERNGTVIREMVANANGDVVRARDLILLAEGIAAVGIDELAFQQRPTPTIWARLADGTVISGVYLQDEEVMGWVTHDFGGFVYAITAIPTDTTDQVWLAVDRFGGTCIEYMQERDAIYGNLMTDSTFIYDGAATDEVDGLFWLEGKEVAIVVDGVEYPNQVVSCGHVGNFHPNITHAEIGMPVEAQLILLRPETPNTMTTGYTINAVKVALSLLDSSGGRVNGQRVYDVFEYPFDVEDGLFTGTLPFHGLNTSNGRMPEIVISHTDAKPFKLRAVTHLIESSTL